LTHREKVDLLLSDLEAKGVGQHTIAPPMFRTLWALGVEIPPPFFIHFLPLSFLFAVGWGIPFGLFYWLMARRNVLLPCTIGAIFFGVFVASYCRWKASSLKLPEWKDYGVGRNSA
jgi:hypothetical protein